MRDLQERRDQVGESHHHSQQRATSLVFKDVPAEVCDNCGEPYTDQQVTEKLQESAREAEQNGAEVIVRRYVA